MTLTKKDVSDIKGIVHNEVENLARIFTSGFEMIDKHFEQINSHFDNITDICTSSAKVH